MNEGQFVYDNLEPDLEWRCHECNCSVDESAEQEDGQVLCEDCEDRIWKEL